MSDGSDQGLVFGMGAEEFVPPDWPRLTLAELDGVLDDAEQITWHSSRPLSTTARVRTGDGREFVVKRLPAGLRDSAALAEEHAFMDHVRERGIPVPRAWTAAERAGFCYEVQEPGAGEDLYQGSFSWSPYLPIHHDAAAAVALARLHLAAAGHDAPARPWRPLKAGFTVFSAADPIARIEAIAAGRPALRDFLEARDWRGDVERVLLPAHRRLRPLLDDLVPGWTHNDWHGTNLLWLPDDGHDPQVPTAVIDFGLADRTTPVHDLATAVERFAVDWISIRDGGPANVDRRSLGRFLNAYTAVRPLPGAEFYALPALFPLVHAEYELSEIDYFLSVVPGGKPEEAEIAYRDYFLGHTEWTETEEGQAFLGLLGS